MERLTKHSKQTSHENGICCTHFRGPECLEVGGNCAMNCKWEEAAWSRLAAYEDTRLEPEEIDMDHEAAEQLRHLCRNCDIDRLEELAEADKNGRVVVLPRWKNEEERLERRRLMRIMADGEVYTGYYNADATDKAVIAHNIQADITMDIIRTNAAIIKDMIEHCEEDE